MTTRPKRRRNMPGSETQEHNSAPGSQIKLSVERFLKFLEKHNYSLTSVYCAENEHVRFAECRTPQQQKTFMVHLPDKYTLVLGSTESDIKKVPIRKDDSGLESRQIKYLSDLKGPLLDCDLVAISSSTLCMYKNSGQTELYDLSGGTESESDVSDGEDSEDEASEEESEDVITGLEKDTTEVLTKVEPGASLPKPQERPPKDSLESGQDKPQEPPEPSPPEPPKETSNKPENKTEESVLKGSPGKGTSVEVEPRKTPPPEPTKIELVFQDDDGESIEDIQEFIEPDETLSQNLKDVKERVSRVSHSDSSKELEPQESASNLEYTTYHNALPPGIEYSDIVLGIVYPMVELGPFFRKIATFEKEVISICEQVDDNILDLRKVKLKEIRELSTAFLAHSETRLAKINEEEKALRSSLIRLTIILSQTEILRKKVAANPEKLSGEAPEVERIYDQTRKTIHDLNIELLRLQDSADELLANYQSSIKELMDL